MAQVGMVDRLTHAVRKVYVGCGYQYAAIFVHDIHDALQRVLRFFPLLDMVHQTQNFSTMLNEEFAFELDVARWILVMNAMTGRAHLLMRLFGLGKPLPPALVKDCPALRAKARLVKFAL
jgi:hypothetical protein